MDVVATIQLDKFAVHRSPPFFYAAMKAVADKYGITLETEFKEYYR